jgi:phosphoribosylformimino-5-aminoimidazole carboxamide ribotide isomerase
MIVMPAVDLRGGACVQLIGGSFAREAVRLHDPVAAARRWYAAGFTRLHVVDLDAAVSGDARRANTPVVEALLREPTETQVGGGVRDADRIDRLLALGAARVVTGTRALEDPAWLERQAERVPGRIVASLDVRRGRPVIRGWTTDSSADLASALDRLVELPLAAVMVTAVDVEGSMRGPDVALVERVRARLRVPLIASGGIGDVEDLRRLSAAGAWAAVVGMALYTGALDAPATAAEFAA